MSVSLADVDPLRVTPPAVHRLGGSGGSGLAHQVQAVACYRYPSFKTTAGQIRVRLAGHPSYTTLLAHSHPTTMGAGRVPECLFLDKYASVPWRNMELFPPCCVGV